MFTAQLGKSDSQLGNIVLASGSASGVPNVTSFLALSQTARGYNGNKIILQNIILTQNLIKHLSSKKTITQTLHFNQAADVIRLKKASNTLTFGQTATATKSKGAHNSLSFVQTLSLTWIHNAVPKNVLHLVQTVVVKVVRNKHVTQTLTLTSHASRTRVLERTVTQHLSLTQLGKSTKVVKPHNSLVLSQLATKLAIKKRSVSQILHLAQSVSCKVTYVRHVSNVLVFQSVYYQDTSITDSTLYYEGVDLPEKPAIDVFETFPIPNAMVTKTDNFVKFRTPRRSIILKRPILGDSENLMDQIDLKRTITARTYTYKRTTKRRLLKYIFELDRQKARELRNFVFSQMSTPMYMTNWKGEIWVGYISNNPFELVGKGRGAPAGDTYSVNIEFSAEKIHG